MGRKLDEDDVIRVMCQRIVGVSEERARIIASHIPTAEPSASDCWSNDNKTTNDSIDTKSSRYSTDRTTDGLISRQAAIDALRYAQHRFTVADEAGGMGTVKWSEYVIYFAAAERVLTDLPSAQPEVIRCKDCKYMTEHYDTDGNVPYWTCSEWDSGTDYDGFCHYAEGRTDDEQRSS